MKPVLTKGYYLLLQSHIEHYLAKNFYNLTAVSLSDGKTYEEMSRFAKNKFNLNIADDQLPNETLEQVYTGFVLIFYIKLDNLLHKFCNRFRD